MLVGREDLFDAAVGDHVAFGRPAVPRYHDPRVEAQRHDCRAVGNSGYDGTRRSCGVAVGEAGCLEAIAKNRLGATGACPSEQLCEARPRIATERE